MAKIQNTLIMMPDDVMKSTSIKASDIVELTELANATGHKLGFHLDRAISNYLADEAPVWLQKVAEVEQSTARQKKSA